LHEGSCAAMADGYARATGKLGVVLIAHIGLPNAMTQMVNSWKDQIPVLVIVDAAGTDAQAYDHAETMVGPITKWYWTPESPAQIPDVTRRAIKFALTPPCGPVFLAMSGLRAEATAAILDQSKFNVTMRVRPDKADVERVARLLLEAKTPLLT